MVFFQNDMQKGVHGRFMDQSTSVREAAVELVGKFILIRPELTEQYYDMLSDRILVYAHLIWYSKVKNKILLYDR